MALPDPREPPMNAVRVETTVEADGKLHLTDLPCRRGDKVGNRDDKPFLP
jgi:hypothetical protein